MANAKNNKTAPRAKLAHKLAKYVRANQTHVPARLSQENPSTTHLSMFVINSAHGGPYKQRLRNNANSWYPADD